MICLSLAIPSINAVLRFLNRKRFLRYRCATGLIICMRVGERENAQPVGLRCSVGMGNGLPRNAVEAIFGLRNKNKYGESRWSRWHLGRIACVIFIADRVQYAGYEEVLFASRSIFDKLECFGQHSLNILFNHANVFWK